MSIDPTTLSTLIAQAVAAAMATQPVASTKPDAHLTTKVQRVRGQAARSVTYKETKLDKNGNAFVTINVDGRVKCIDEDVWLFLTAKR
jgi:hypothetical protein